MADQTLAICGCCSSAAGRCGDLPADWHCHCCPLHPGPRPAVTPPRSVLQQIADHYWRVAGGQDYARAVWTWEGQRAYWRGTAHETGRDRLPGCAGPRWRPAEVWPDDSAARSTAERITAARRGGRAGVCG